MSFVNWFKKYSKFWVALLGAVLTTLSLYFPTSQWVTLVITFATALGVYAARNKV